MTRQSKTDRQRAEERLGVAQRRVKRLEDQLTHQRGVVDATFTELTAARQRLEYAEADPALRPREQHAELPDPPATVET